MDVLYVAAKPVRFDRDYVIGEIIPNDVIDLTTVRRLIIWGKLASIDPDTIPEEE